MKKYIVWSPYRVGMCGGFTVHDLTTYEGMREAEGSISMSSIIKVKNKKQLRQFLKAVYNETDVELCYHRLP